MKDENLLYPNGFTDHKNKTFNRFWALYILALILFAGLVALPGNELGGISIPSPQDLTNQENTQTEFYLFEEIKGSQNQTPGYINMNNYGIDYSSIYVTWNVSAPEFSVLIISKNVNILMTNNTGVYVHLEHTGMAIYIESPIQFNYILQLYTYDH